MPKRKRSDIEDRIDNIEDRAVRIKASRLQIKIEHGNQSLKTALGLARGFERQKLGRRQKQASNEPHTLLRLREEVIVLKELDLGKTANNYLFKQLVKTKRIRESATFVALYGEDPKTEPPKNNAEANVLGRLFKANPVKEVFPGVMNEIKQVLKLEDPKSGGVNGSPAISSERTQLSAVDNSPASAIEDEAFRGFSDDLMGDNTSAKSDVESDPDEEALYDAYKDRLAALSDGSEEESALSQLDPLEISDADSQDRYGVDSISLSGGDDISDQDISTPKPQRKAFPEKVASTSFLPSLSMGGYYSGSESGDDDDFDQVRGPALPKERKNRRGQRERQRLAEMKFGKDAKHLQNQQKQMDSKNSGWDAKRGAVDGARYDPRQKRFAKGSFVRVRGPTGANGEAVVGDRSTRSSKPTTKKPEGPMHPSWEAARKRKQETGKVAFAGKKITFD